MKLLLTMIAMFCMAGCFLVLVVVDAILQALPLLVLAGVIWLAVAMVQRGNRRQPSVAETPSPTAPPVITSYVIAAEAPAAGPPTNHPITAAGRAVPRRGSGSGLSRATACHRISQ